MTLYIAVTGDEYELPLYVADSANEMAAWAGIKARSVQAQACRNAGKPPLRPNATKREYRIRKIIMEDDENDEK